MSKSLALLAVVVSAQVLAADFKAAYVDIQRALQETDEGKAAKTRLQAMVDARQKPFDKEKNALQAEVEAFQKQASTMDDKVRAEREATLQKKTIELSQKAQRMTQEMQESERKELGAIMPKLEGVLSQIAQREGLTMVFDRSSSGLAWAPPSLDLTNELIRLYNAQYKAGGTTTSVAKPAATPAAPK